MEKKRVEMKGKKENKYTVRIVVFVIVCAILAGCFICAILDANGKKSVEADTQQTEKMQNDTQPEEVQSEVKIDLHEYDFTMCFAGDFNLGVDEPTTAQLNAAGGDISQCISPELIQNMQNADLFLLNNEFTFSNQGAPLEGKMYTFRANPDNVKVWNTLGVDVAQLANNHVFDFGRQAMLDTFQTLTDAGIPYVGAGKNLEEAMTPFYTEIQGKKIAIVAASRAEKYRMTPQATESDPGILRCYDTELFKQEIREARANADIVIAVVHWGKEGSNYPEEVQEITGKEYIDEGADIIIGGHSHRLGGVEFYKNKPIFYSLGNFWFDCYDLETMLVNIRFYGNDDEQHIALAAIPAIQRNSKTTICKTQEEKDRVLGLLQRISVNAHVDENGGISEVLPSVQ